MTANSFAAKKDFKGLFGSYKRERFVENEGRNNVLGVDVMLSTLLPLTTVVKSSEDDRTGNQGSMNYATFFNVEASAFYTLAYNWELFLSVAWMNYETRKENSKFRDPALPLFHQFEFEAIPVILGVKYRFSMEDFVPYVGLGAGMSYVRRKSYYDYNTSLVDQEYKSPITAEAILGAEFFFSSRAGLRLEVATYYFNLPERLYYNDGDPARFPYMRAQGNVWSVRYASGVFFLF